MSLQPWQRANILAAANYLRDLRDQTGAGTANERSLSIYQGLLETLDPARRVARLQREMAVATKAAASAGQERRRADERRRKDRRKADLGVPTQGERRAGKERRSAADRRR